MGFYFDDKGVENAISYIKKGRNHVDSAMWTLSANNNRYPKNANIENQKKALTNLETLDQSMDNLKKELEKAIADMKSLETQNAQLMNNLTATSASLTAAGTSVTKKTSTTKAAAKKTAAAAGGLSSKELDTINSIAASYCLNFTSKEKSSLITQAKKLKKNYSLSDTQMNRILYGLEASPGDYMTSCHYLLDSVLDMVKKDLKKQLSSKKITKAQYNAAIKLINKLNAEYKKKVEAYLKSSTHSQEDVQNLMAYYKSVMTQMNIPGASPQTSTGRLPRYASGVSLRFAQRSIPFRISSKT